MENQDSNSSAILENTEIDDSPTQESESPSVNVEVEKWLLTDQEAISSLIEEAFPKQTGNKQLGIPQSDAFRFASRIFYLWVWPIIFHNKVRNLLNNMDFVRPYEEKSQKGYEVKDTETVYTMTKEAFSGKGGMKFMGIRFMSIWVFPMAITGAVMEFLFVGPLKGTNPFG